MSKVRIEEIKINGFRAFGEESQIINLSAPIISVYAPNSHGKTSLAEAFEFLLTGEIVRRNLMAGALDEFSNALRNAHMPDSGKVYVEASIIDIKGSPHTIKRTLTSDYGKRNTCESTFEIDGNFSTDFRKDLAFLGITFSQPPFSVPVLAQHTLGYLFSSAPKERSLYFKALLEVSDLESFRGMITQVEKEIRPKGDSLCDDLDCVIKIPGAEGDLGPLVGTVPSLVDLTSAFERAIKEVITVAGEDAPESLEQLINTLDKMLSDRRSQTFPVGDFKRQDYTDWIWPSQDNWDALSNFKAESDKVDEKTRRLTKLFQVALEIPNISVAKESLDCPLCEAKESLTQNRIESIRNQIRDAEGYQKAEKRALKGLNNLIEIAHDLEKSIDSLCPIFLVKLPKQRHADGFRINKISDLLSDLDSDGAVQSWFAALRTLARSRKVALRSIKNISNEIFTYKNEPDKLNDFAHVKESFKVVERDFNSFRQALRSYAEFDQIVLGNLNRIIDSNSDTEYWQTLIKLARDLKKLHIALIKNRSHIDVHKELKSSVQKFDRGSEKIVENKFQNLSDDIRYWWDILRPEDHAFFSAVKLRERTQKSIDFKASLSIDGDRSVSKIRSAIAVFSQSQLHCLGLAIFIARSLRENVGFMVLDDPILSSDESYGAYFKSDVLTNLLKRGVQIILFTQNQKIWEDLENRYQHEGISMFEMNLDNPSKGVIVTAGFDDFRERFRRIGMLIRSDHLSMRKDAAKLIRDTAERFCKELLVKDSRKRNSDVGELSDYDGKVLGELINDVAPLLDDDRSHIGKMDSIRKEMNPGSHDGVVPSRGELKVSFGNLRDLEKIYLSRKR